MISLLNILKNRTGFTEIRRGALVIKAGMHLRVLVFLLPLLVIAAGCSHEELPLPVIPPADEQFPSYVNPDYIRINPSFDAANGYTFSRPADIYYGIDNFLYVADTDNNRIVMMDLGGTIQGTSQPIEHPGPIPKRPKIDFSQMPQIAFFDALLAFFRSRL